MKRIVYTSFILLLAFNLFAQEGSNFGIRFSGFVKNDFFFDSRQTVAAREGHFLLWPSDESLDELGHDINAKSSFNMLAVQSRLKGSITGPDAFGANTSGVIEGDFFAQANDNINLFRLRHAFVKLKWTNLELLAGQYWNPLFVTDCFPGTVSFNTGTPLQSFARNPQIRMTYNAGKLRFLAAVLSQRDYASVGADGSSSSYLRNSSIPDLHFQMQFGSVNNGTGNTIIIGGGLAYKTIVPRLESIMAILPTRNYKVDEKVGGLTAIAYSNLTTQKITVKWEARFGENISDLLAISGFAVKEVTDPISGQRTYTPLQSLTFWGEVHTHGKFQVGLFGGFLKNMGTREEILTPVNVVYGLATDINTLIRISPRFIINSEKTRIALEAEYTMAAFGNNYDTYYVPATTTAVSNLRALLAIYYFF